MRTALVLAAALIARAASAQPGATPPTPAPTPAPGQTPPAPNGPPLIPSPHGTPGTTAPTTPTSSEPLPPDAAAPVADPAYRERPDSSIQDPSQTDRPGIRRGREIVVRYTPSRDKKNITTLALIGGTGIVFGAVGLYFHLDSQSASDEVSAKTFTGRPWTQERQDLFDEAHRSKNIAWVTYGVGSALLLTTAIYYMVTEPAQVETVLRPHTQGKPITMIAPTDGGAMVGSRWSF